MGTYRFLFFVAAWGRDCAKKPRFAPSRWCPSGTIRSSGTSCGPMRITDLRRFILCLGYKAEVIKSYFLNYPSMNSDFTVELKTNDVTVHTVDHDQDWQVTLAYTGELTMTGARVARAAAQVSRRRLILRRDVRRRRNRRQPGGRISIPSPQKRLGTVLGVNPPSRFGELKLEDAKVEEFAKSPNSLTTGSTAATSSSRGTSWPTSSAKRDCVLERDPLVKLARDGELSMYKHRGFWACMDTQRDREHLNKLWASGQAPWAV